MRSLFPRRFAALLSPRRVHVLEYRNSRGVLQPVRARELPGPFATAGEAAARLASWARDEAGASARLCVALSEFDTQTHLLTLPAAPDEVLRPVVERESARFAPQLFQPGRRPHVAYARLGVEEEAGARRQRLLVGLAPAGVVEEVEAEIGAQGVALDHFTLLAAAVRRLYGAYGSEGAPSATLLLLDAPVVGFFHEGEMRLFFEPPTVEGGWGAAGSAQVLQLLERGSLYLRQEFRGATLSQALVAAEADERDALSARIAAALSVEVKPLHAGNDGSPGSLAALGTALDCELPDGLNLLPPERRPEPSNLLERALAYATMAVLLLATVWWAASAVRTADAAGDRVAELQRTVAARAVRFREIRPDVEERRAHAQRGEVLDALNAEMMHLPELLNAIYPEGISVDTFRFTRTDEQWDGSLVATARGATSAGAAARVNEYFRWITDQLPGSTVSLTRLTAQRPGSAQQNGDDASGVAIDFEVLLSVPLAPDE